MPVSRMRMVPYIDSDDAVLTSTVTLPDGYEPENLQNTVRSSYLRTDDLTSFEVRGVYPEARTMNSLFLFRHLLHGANVRLYAYSDATWTTPASPFSDSSSQAALCYTASETYTNSRGTNDPFKSESPFWYFFSATSIQSFKLTVSGTPSAVSYFHIGRLVMGRYIELSRNPDWGFQMGWQDSSRRRRTDGGTLRARRGAFYKTMNIELADVDPLERATLLQIDRENGTAKDIVVSVFPGDGTSLERDNCVNCTMTALDALGMPTYGQLTKKFQFEEN